MPLNYTGKAINTAMKLFELIEPKVTNHDTEVNPHQFDKMMNNTGATNPTYMGNGQVPTAKNPKVKVLGAGVYGSAIQPANSHEAMKISRGTSNLERDAYFQYVSALARNPDVMMTNPYFPRIYKIKTFANSNTESARRKYFFFVQMEKLQPLSSCSREELGYFFNKYASEKLTDDTVQTVSMEDLLDGVGALFHHMFDGSAGVQDKLLRQAKQFITNLKVGIMDMHSGNIMVRRTSVGPQLVITDPLVNSW